MWALKNHFGRKTPLQMNLHKIIANWFISVMLVYMDIEIFIQRDRKTLVPHSLKKPIFLIQCCIGSEIFEMAARRSQCMSPNNAH